MRRTGTWLYYTIWLIIWPFLWVGLEVKLRAECIAAGYREYRSEMGAVPVPDRFRDGFRVIRRYQKKGI